MKRSFSLGALAAVAFVAACSSGANAGANATTPETRSGASFRGVYGAAGAGPIGDIAFLDDGNYVLRPSDCHAVECVEAGATSFDAGAKRLTLGTRTFSVEIVAKVGTTSDEALRPRDLVDRDAGLVDDAGVPLTTVTEAKLDGQPVQLVEQPAWPGLMPGTGPLRSPADGEVVTLHPGGNSVTTSTSMTSRSAATR